MNISWTSGDPFNAEVVDNGSEQVLFHLDTPFQLIGSVTTMTDAQGQVVAEYERRPVGYDRVTYQGQTHRVSDWLPTNGFFSSSRRLQAPDGKTYLWKAKSGAKFKLVNERSDAVVATTHAANLGILSPKHNIIIDAGFEVVAFLDLVVLSFLICESERQARQRRRHGNNMSAMNMNGAMAGGAF
ncbi:hypothetical protein GSI_09157 [Ganoderma sinense ZZ0214-1]|uniref:DUF6593 domain-containing protein n=1 Tax=Ganoderma sinense ZZ0214-1 TaxID=1077348 RepID=A0A2G8S5P4_9APHY|nr:hypothetical protein GSI_09157 [Ganoderma sinense ZZ0214-1]